MRESLLKWDIMFWVLFVELNEKLMLVENVKHTKFNVK